MTLVPDVLDGSASNPAGNVRMGAVTLANLGNDVRVEQEFHRLTSRQSRSARLVEDAGESLVGKLGAKHVEGGLDLGIDERPGQRRPKRLGLFVALPRNVSASARMRPASFLGA